MNSLPLSPVVLTGKTATVTLNRLTRTLVFSRCTFFFSVYMEPVLSDHPRRNEWWPLNRGWCTLDIGEHGVMVICKFAFFFE